MDLFDIVAARQGSGGSGTPQVQSDWNEINENSKAYIKNKPFYDESRVEVGEKKVEIRKEKFNEAFQSIDRLYIIPNKTYKSTVEILSADETVLSTLTSSVDATVLPGATTGLSFDVTLISVPGYFQLMYAVDFTGTSEPEYNENITTFIAEDELFTNINFIIEGEFDIIKIKKIDKKFLPDSMSIELTNTITSTQTSLAPTAAAVYEAIYGAMEAYY